MRPLNLYYMSSQPGLAVDNKAFPIQVKSTSGLRAFRNTISFACHPPGDLAWTCSCHKPKFASALSPPNLRIMVSDTKTPYSPLSPDDNDATIRLLTEEHDELRSQHLHAPRATPSTWIVIVLAVLAMSFALSTILFAGLWLQAKSTFDSIANPQLLYCAFVSQSWILMWLSTIFESSGDRGHRIWSCQVSFWSIEQRRGRHLQPPSLSWGGRSLARFVWRWERCCVELTRPDLSPVGTIGLTESEASHLVNKTAMKGDKYIVGVDVFHQLHCLVRFLCFGVIFTLLIVSCAE